MKTKNTFVFIWSPSLPLPSVLSSSVPPLLRAGREGQQSRELWWRAALSTLASQTQLQDSLLIFTRKLEHFSKWKIFC